MNYLTALKKLMKIHSEVNGSCWHSVKGTWEVYFDIEIMEKISERGYSKNLANISIKLNIRK